MLFHKVGAVVLFVQDLDKMAKFYCDVLGLAEAVSDENSVALKMEDHDFLLLKASEAVAMLGPEVVQAEKWSGQRAMLCADVEDVDAAFKDLTVKGVKFFKGPVDQPWGMRAAYFTDPEGNIWELRKFFKK